MISTACRREQVGGEDGALVVEASVFFTFVAAVVFLAVHFTFWLWAGMLVEQASQQALQAVAVAGPDISHAERQAIAEQAVAAMHGTVGGTHEPSVAVATHHGTAGHVRVTITVTAKPLSVAFFTWEERTGRAGGQVEQWIPFSDRQ